MEKENDKVQLINDDEIITLTADDGTQVDFYEVAVVEYDDELYAILEPAQDLEDMDDGEVLIFKIEENDDPDADEDIFTIVSDEEILQAVFDEYLKAVSSENSDCGEECEGCGEECEKTE